jgi:hypothetical protein
VPSLGLDKVLDIPEVYTKDGVSIYNLDPNLIAKLKKVIKKDGL